MDTTETVLAKVEGVGLDTSQPSGEVVERVRFYCHSSERMPEVASDSVALTVTSPPYWNAIDYDVHANGDGDEWYRERQYVAFGKTFKGYLRNLSRVFNEVLRVTAEGGFCAIVIGTVLHDSKHYPVPMLVTERMQAMGWEFHQDIIWNKVTGGVLRAGSFIQRPRAGYYYPNIMTEYILIFRKPGPPLRGRATAMDIDDLFTRDIANNIWHIAPVPPHTIAHPCPFPEELARRLVLLYSEPGDEVLDPFLGSGQTAILFVLAGVGIVFGAPDMVDAEHVRDTGDALEFTQRGVAALVEDSANVLEMEIAYKQPTEMTGFSHKASTALARQILFENQAQTLLKAFPAIG